MRQLAFAALLFVAACASSRDRDAIAGMIEAETALQRLAWEKRDASIMLPPGPMRDDVQRRMNMTRSIEEMTVQVGDIEVSGDEAIAYSHQRFVRVMAVDGKERKRVSTVTHKQRYRREGAKWVPSAPLEELDQKAYWAD